MGASRLSSSIETELSSCPLHRELTVYIVAHAICYWSTQWHCVHLPSTYYCFVTNFLLSPSRNATLAANSSGSAYRLMIEIKLSFFVMVHDLPSGSTRSCLIISVFMYLGHKRLTMMPLGPPLKTTHLDKPCIEFLDALPMRTYFRGHIELVGYLN